MGKKLIQLLAIVATALYFVPTGAHLFELPHKMALSPAEYITVQQIYTGWELFGIVIAVALLAILANTLLVRADRRAFAWSLTAFLALAATQGALEFSHAASALLTFVALVTIVFASLTHRSKEDRRSS